MKNKLLTFALAVSALASYAQSPYFRSFRPGHRSSHSASTSQSQFRSEGKVQLDSIVSPKYMKETYTYSTNGYISTTYNWDSTSSKWRLNSRFQNQVDANGNQTMYANYNWVDSISQWVGSGKYEFTFDANNNETSYINYEWVDSTMSWGATNKGESTFDNKGNKTMSLSYTWDSSINDWNGNSKSVYTFDAYGNKLTFSLFLWNASSKEWVLSSNPGTYSYENTLDNLNRATVSTSYFTLNSIKYYSNKDEYAYDSYGNQILSASYYWSGSKWVGSSRTEHAYNANGLETLYAYYNWNSTNSQWVGSNKYESTYSTDGNKTLAIDYNWDYTNNQWVGREKYSYEYDKTILESSLTVPYSKTNGFINKMTFVYDYLWLGSDWSAPMKLTLYYSDGPTGIVTDGMYGNAIRLYPNPAKETLVLEGANFGNYQIQDLTGKTLQSAYTQGNSIGVGQLNQGVYLLTIEQGNKKQVFKFVKE